MFPVFEASDFLGASVAYEKELLFPELSLREIILRLLEAENRKVLLLQDPGEKMLRRIISAEDVWRLLIGPEKAASSLQEVTL
ncbi:unnamed protein product [Symbiodinium sp. KB8]|nr:unnamed protein product [Symbiodinium sp. KB8]